MLWIRIRTSFGRLDPDRGEQSFHTIEKSEEISYFNVLHVLVQVEGCSLDNVLHGGLRINVLQFLIQKMGFFSSIKFYNFGHQNPGSPSAMNPMRVHNDFNRIFSSKISILYIGRNSYNYLHIYMLRNSLNYKFLAYNLIIFLCPGNTSGPPIPISIRRSQSLLRSAQRQRQRPLADTKKGAATLIPTPQPRERGQRRRPHASARYTCTPASSCTCSRGRTRTC